MASKIPVLASVTIDPTPVISTGNFLIDHRVILAGGIPRGLMTEIYGGEGGGKTTLVLQTCASAHKQGLRTLFIDAEHALNVEYARGLGINPELFGIVQPMSAEEAIDTIYSETPYWDMIVCDSIAALVPQEEIDKDASDNVVALQARLLSRGLRKILPLAKRHQTAIVFTNQLRSKVGVTYGSTTTTPGGNAPKFFASLRLEVVRIKTNKQGDIAVSQDVKVVARKNKLAPPYREAVVQLTYGAGFDDATSIFDIGVELGIITKSKSTYYFGDDKLGVGRPAAAGALTPDQCAVIREAAR
jgi:recombination protein RecA